MKQQRISIQRTVYAIQNKIRYKLKSFKALSASHVWYSGVLHTQTNAAPVQNSNLDSYFKLKLYQLIMV